MADITIAEMIHTELEMAGHVAGEWPELIMEFTDEALQLSRRTIRSWYWIASGGGRRSLVLSATRVPPVDTLMERIAQQADSLTPELRAQVLAYVAQESEVRADG
jgi:hypothetical protein